MSTQEDGPARRPLPHVSDVHAWREIARTRDWEGYWNEDLAAALRNRSRTTPNVVINIITVRLTGEINRILRKNVRKSYPNGGLDIMAEARSVIFAAICDPTSSDGNGFTQPENFEYRIEYRATDAVKKYLQHLRRDGTSAQLAEGASADRIASTDLLTSVNALIDAMPDPAQRLTCRLMLGGIKQEEIAVQIGRTSRTVRTYLKGFKDTLRRLRNEGAI